MRRAGSGCLIAGPCRRAAPVAAGLLPPASRWLICYKGVHQHQALRGKTHSIRKALYICVQAEQPWIMIGHWDGAHVRAKEMGAKQQREQRISGKGEMEGAWCLFLKSAWHGRVLRQQ